MKKINFLIIGIVFHVFSHAQSFSSPESVEFDAQNNRWFVGQNGSGKINIYDPSTGMLSSFASNIPNGPHGIEILANTLYCCDGNKIKGYDLGSGNLVFNLTLSGSTFLNGLTTDGSNFLFATDFSAKKIFRINPQSNTFNLMASTTKTPNGIYYDQANNRCVFVTWSNNASIQAMSLADSSILTLKSTNLGNMDGITRDQNGNWYFTAWSNNSLLKVDAAFVDNPISVLSGLSSPADIDINATGDSIAIPNSGTANNVVFYEVENSAGQNELEQSECMKLFPNPSGQNEFKIVLQEPIINGTIQLINSNGEIVLSASANGYIFSLNPEHLPSGTYLVEVKTIHSSLHYKEFIIIQ
jgi:hypothetical protein